MVYLYKIRLYDETEGEMAAFNTAVHCVLNLFIRLIRRKLVTQNVRIVNIHVNNNRERHFNYQLHRGTINVYYDFNQLNYTGSNTAYERKKAVLDIVYHVIGYLASVEKWDVDVVIDTYNRCLELKIKNEWWFRDKLITAPGRRYKAGLYHVYDIDTFEIFIVLFDRNKKELIRHLIFKDHVDTFQIHQFAWLDTDRIAYKFKGPDKKFVYSVQDLLNSQVKEIPEKIQSLFE